MKKSFFKIGLALELFLVFIHLYYNRNGLPIPNTDEKSRELLDLMRTYEITYSSGAAHTLDQTIWGYDLTWASFALFAFIVSIVALRFPSYSARMGKYVAGSNAFLWLLCTIAALLFWSPPQQIFFGLIFIIFAISFFFEWKLPRKYDTKICVVGAGISGLTAAYELHKKGYDNVTVLEKANYISGKCKTDIIDDHPFDLGGHEMLAGYTDIITIGKELNAPSQRSIPPLVYDSNKKEYLNFKESATASGKYNKMQLGIAALKYLWLVGITFRNYAKPSTGYKNMPKELTMVLDDWLEYRNLQALKDILVFVVKVQGYGGFSKTPAAYLVKFMGFKNWGSLLLSGMGIYKKWPRIFTYGMENLCDRMAATLIDVRINQDIDKIERNHTVKTDGVRVYLKGKEHPLVFDKLIVSTPLDAKTLNFLDLKAEARNLFDNIKTFNFYTTLCKVEGLPAGVVASNPLNDADKGEYNGYIKDFTDEPYAMFFSLADNKSITAKKVIESISNVLSRVPPYKDVQPKVLSVEEQKLWQYFPHIELDEDIAGIYNGIEKLQGEKHTYYSSSALTFECVGNSVAYAKRLIHKEF